MERISFNGGATYWEYNTPERLEEIKAFLARRKAIEASEAPPVTPRQIVQATLRTERAMFW